MSLRQRLPRIALAALLAIQEPALCLAQSTQTPGAAGVSAGPRLTDEERRALERPRRAQKETSEERAHREALERWHRESREEEARQPIRERNLREAALGLKPVLQARGDGSTSAVTGDLWKVLEQATAERAYARQGLVQAARARRNAGQPSQTLSERWDELARNDAVAGYAIAGAGELAAVAGWTRAAAVIGNIPADDIADVAGKIHRGQSNAAAIAYTKGWVGWLAGFTAAEGASAYLTGAVVMGVTAPGWVITGAAITTGIGVGWLAKQGMGYILDEYGPRSEESNASQERRVPAAPVGRQEPLAPHPAQPVGDPLGPAGIAAGSTTLQLPTQPLAQPVAPPRVTAPPPPPINVPRQTVSAQPAPLQSPVGTTGTCRICGGAFTRAHNDGGLCMECAAREASRRSLEDFMKKKAPR